MPVYTESEKTTLGSAKKILYTPGHRLVYKQNDWKTEDGQLVEEL